MINQHYSLIVIVIVVVVMGNRGSSARPSSSSDVCEKENDVKDDDVISNKYASIRKEAMELWFTDSRFLKEQREHASDSNHDNDNNNNNNLNDRLYDNIWFVKTECVLKRTRLDAHISSRFGWLLNELAEFYENRNRNNDHHMFIEEALDQDATKKEVVIATVIVLDQFARHHFRFINKGDDDIETLDKVCAEIVDEYLKKTNNNNNSISIDDSNELIFLLMPYRHTQKTLTRLEKLLHLIDAKISTTNANSKLLQKFKETSKRCYQDLEGKKWDEETNSEILEHYEFTPTLEQIERATKLPIVKCVNDFFLQQKCSSFTATKSICVSLSGGVDSMVLAMILKHVLKMHDKVIALHINYGNRPEANAEAAFLAKWCAKHEIIFEIKTMQDNQLKRGVTPREIYEIEARRIRFDFYKEFQKKYDFPAVLLGHHHGDVQENVITNMFRGANVLAINGMSDEGIIENVRIWRPMLSREKSDVLEFAHLFGVPYFLDSTPTWSTRGKLRNDLIPLLAEMFGDGFLKNVSLIGENSEMLDKMVQNSIFDPFYANMHISDSGIYVTNCEKFMNQPLFFWKETLREFCHKLGTNGFKDHSIDKIVQKMVSILDSSDPIDSRNLYQWLPVKRENKVFLTTTTTKGTMTLAMFAEAFSANETIDGFKAVSISSTDLKREKLQTRKCGPWTITIELIEKTHDIVQSLENPTLISMWDVLENKISYVMPFKVDSGDDEKNKNNEFFTINTDWKIAPTCDLDSAVRKYLPIVCPLGTPPHKSEKDKSKKHRTWAPRHINNSSTTITSETKEDVENTCCCKVTLAFHRKKPFSEVI